MTAVKPFRVRAVERAATFIGVKEHPPGSNHGARIDNWCFRTNGLRGGYPWCAAFVYSMFSDIGYRVPAKQPALVESWVRMAKERGWTVTRPRRGDVVALDFDTSGWRDHIGLIERTLALRTKDGRFTGWIQTVEGNTSAQPGSIAQESNGGGVFRRRRWVNGYQVFIRIPGP